VVPIPVELTAEEKAEICREICLDHVITARRIPSFLEPFRRGEAMELSATSAVVPVSRTQEAPPGFAAINSAFIRFTSGTTGSAKGVVLSHETIDERIRAANEVLRIGPGDRVVWLLSMSYHFAVSIVNYLTFGAAIIFPANHLAPAVLTAATQHQGTVIYGSPAHYAWMAACEQAAELKSLRLALSSTAALEPGTSEGYQRRFGLPVAQALGIIEIGLPFINLDFAADRPAAVGRVLPAYELRLEDVGLGEDRREVLLRGKGFLDAYYRPWRVRSEIMPDGWFHTGDLGALDADRCLFLHGRSKDVISVLGMKVFPQEIEAVLMAHPGVQSASVFPQHDGRLGEVPCARVVVRQSGNAPTESEILEHCRTRLAGFKVPHRIEFVASLPRTASGKILRRSREPDHDGQQITAP
jgi:long-chain acyl-CoA synthetase